MRHGKFRKQTANPFTEITPSTNVCFIFIYAHPSKVWVGVSSDIGALMASLLMAVRPKGSQCNTSTSSSNRFRTFFREIILLVIVPYGECLWQNNACRICIVPKNTTLLAWNTIKLVHIQQILVLFFREFVPGGASNFNPRAGRKFAVPGGTARRRPAWLVTIDLSHSLLLLLLGMTYTVTWHEL